jgi:hypothetical protein
MVQARSLQEPVPRVSISLATAGAPARQFLVPPLCRGRASARLSGCVAPPYRPSFASGVYPDFRRGIPVDSMEPRQPGARGLTSPMRGSRIPGTVPLLLMSDSR